MTRNPVRPTRSSVVTLLSAVRATARASMFTMLAAALIGLTPITAHAHGSLKSASPAAGETLSVLPRQLKLVFTEAPALAFSRLQLLTASGTAVALSPIRIAADSRRALVADVVGSMTAGTYTVVWQMAGDDGHPVRGQHSFTVAPGARAADPIAPTLTVDRGDGTRAAPAPARRAPESGPQPAAFDAESPGYVAVRALLYLGLIIVIGAVAFETTVLQVLRWRRRSGDSLLPNARFGAAQLGLLGCTLVGSAALLRLGAQLYAMRPPGETIELKLVRSVLTETVWGWGWLLQVVGVLVATAGFRAAIRRSGGWGLATLGVVGLALTPALSGHAAATPSQAGLAIMADALHVIGAGGWLGSLLVVLIAGIPATMRLPDEERGAAVIDLFNAFSPTALLFAGIVATTGVFAGWTHLPTVSALWQSSYGRTLLLKLAVLSVVGGLGVYNWLKVKPMLGSPVGLTRLRVTARVELLVGLVVIIVTAVLVATPTPMEMPSMKSSAVIEPSMPRMPGS